VRPLALHLAVAAAYVTLGVLFPVLLYSWIEGAAFYLLGAWAIPALVRRWR
jgi:hypothetical protein